MRIEHEHIYHNPTTGTRDIVRTERYAPSDAAERDATATVINNVIWYVLGVIGILLAVRVVLLLLGANETPFTNFVYDLTAPLVAPFAGMFPAPVIEQSYFDTASIVAMIVYAIAAWAVSALVDLLLRPDRV